MLRDITAQTIQSNTEHQTCIRHNNKNSKHCKKQVKHVKFDAKAMAAERVQKIRITAQPRTPSKAKEVEKPLIGSSSTWNNDQLDQFVVEQGVLDVRRMIPEKWFDFGQIENYQSVRNQVTSVTSDEIYNNRVIVQKAPNFTITFRNLQDLKGLSMTDNCQDALAEKRREKRAYGHPTSAILPEWVGPPLPDPTPEEKHRIASISDPSKSSAGSKLFTATQEQESETLATSFFRNVLMMLFWDDPVVAWATGRENAKPVVRWRNCHLAAEIKIGDGRIGARTDGGLQLFLPLNQNLVAWDRSYYEIALEAKRFHRTKRDKEGHESTEEIDNPGDPIHAGQIFAEMLGAVCHPEFFNHTEVEAYVIYIRHASFQLYHCRFPQQYLKEMYHDGEPSSGGVTLNQTRTYDFCEVKDRGDWFDIFVALIQYLLSGESKVGFLNNRHPWNLIHKQVEDEQVKREQAIQEQLEREKEEQREREKAIQELKGEKAKPEQLNLEQLNLTETTDYTDEDAENDDPGDSSTSRKRGRSMTPPVPVRRSRRNIRVAENTAGKRRF